MRCFDLLANVESGASRLGKSRIAKQVLRAIGAVEEIERMAELAVKLLQFSPIWKTMPNCLATLFPTSLSTAKVSSSFSCVLSELSGNCGEMATICAPNC